jgi:hypothetical protein
LLKTPALTPPHGSYVPYIGDYADLIAGPNAFYGVFSASNDPVKATSPFGVTFQRFTRAGRLCAAATGVCDVPVSIDPYFFRVTLAP